MKEYVKTYLMGLLTIAVILHPLLVAKLMGMQMNKPSEVWVSYFCSIVIEIFVIIVIGIPFVLGLITQKAIRETT